MHYSVRLPLSNEHQKAMIILGDVEIVKGSNLAGYLFPSPNTFSDRPDWRERRCLQLVVDVATRQIIDDCHFVVSRRKVQCRGPATKTVAAKKENFQSRCPMSKMISGVGPMGRDQP